MSKVKMKKFPELQYQIEQGCNAIKVLLDIVEKNFPRGSSEIEFANDTLCNLEKLERSLELGLPMERGENDDNNV